MNLDDTDPEPEVAAVVRGGWGDDGTRVDPEPRWDARTAVELTRPDGVLAAGDRSAAGPAATANDARAGDPRSWDDVPTAVDTTPPAAISTLGDAESSPATASTLADLTPPPGVPAGADAEPPTAESAPVDVTPPDPIPSAAARRRGGPAPSRPVAGAELASIAAALWRRLHGTSSRRGLLTNRRFRPGVRTLAAGVAALSIAALAAGLRSRGDRSEARPSASTAGPSAPACFDAALAAIRAEDFGEAARLLERSAELDPAREEIARYRERVGQELLAAASIEAARRCVQGGDGACAEAALGRLPRDSLVAERHAGEIREALAGQPDAAEPSDDAAPSGSAGVGSGDAPPTPAVPAPGAPNALERSGTGGRAPPPRGPKPQVVRKASSGRSSRAASAETDTGAHGGTLDVAASARMVQAGVRARLSDDLVLAAERFIQALAADPSNADARRELEAIRARLAEIFRRAHARMEADPERAARGLRLVARLAPPGDPLRGKAEEGLARLPAEGGRRL